MSLVCSVSNDRRSLEEPSDKSTDFCQDSNEFLYNSNDDSFLMLIVQFALRFAPDKRFTKFNEDTLEPLSAHL